MKTLRLSNKFGGITVNNENIMTIEECASILNMNPQTVRECIENKTFEFGRCFLSGRNRKIYKISRIAFNRWYNGESIAVD